jgi:hypothetical protein
LAAWAIALAAAGETQKAVEIQKRAADLAKASGDLDLIKRVGGVH